MEVHSLYVREKQTKNYPPNLAGYFRFFVETLQDLGNLKILGDPAMALLPFILLTPLFPCRDHLVKGYLWILLSW